MSTHMQSIVAYDEDLHSNPFLQAIRRDYPDVYKACVRERWIICVPQRAAVKGPSHFSREQIGRHILIPDHELPRSHFHLSCGTDQAVLHQRQDGGGAVLVVGEKVQRRVLFTETVYDDDMNRCHIWCLDAPMEELTEAPDSYLAADVADAIDCHHLIELQTVGDSMQFLGKFVGGAPLLTKLKHLCQAESKHSHLYITADLRALASRVQSLYSSALKVASDFPHVKNRREWHSAIGQAVEMIVMHHIGGMAMEALCSLFAQDDAKLNKAVLNASLGSIDAGSLGVPEALMPTIVRAQRELCRMRQRTTATAKLSCLSKSLSLLLNHPATPHQRPVSSDELLPAMVYMVYHSSTMANWFAHLHFISDFRLSKATDTINDGDRTSFELATLEAALEHIAAGGLDAFSSCHETKAHSSEQLSHLMQCIARDDLAAARLLLQEADSSPAGGYVKETWSCHPLCLCPRCQGLQVDQSSRMAGAGALLAQVDDAGRTALHMASIFGRVLFTELFLSLGKRETVNRSDEAGASALHHAAQRGHQNVLLLLLHAEADLSVTDRQGNTPLMMAALFGHESCVKAILYYAEYKAKPAGLQAQNRAGDTALHLASRWGHLEVARILATHGAEWILSKNKKRETPISCAHSPRMAALLRSALLDPHDTRPDPPQPPPPASASSPSRDQSRLFKALNINDLPLVRYFLRLEPQHMDIRNVDGWTLVHSAAHLGNVEALQLFLRHGASATAVTYGKRQTALHLACLSGHLAVAVALMGDTTWCDTMVNASDLDGNSALHHCVSTGNYQIAHLLLKRGARVHLENLAGKTPIDTAVDKQQFALKELLDKFKDPSRR